MWYGILVIALLGVGAVLWMHRLDNIGTDRTPPYGGGGIATDGSDADGARTDEPDMMC